MSNRSRAICAICVACAGALCTAPASAGVPTYESYELQARADFPTSFNIPAGSSISNVTAVLNDGRSVAFGVPSVRFSLVPGIWFGGGGTGGIVHESPSDAYSVGDVAMNNAGLVAFEEHQFFSSDGIFVYDPGDDSVTPTIAPGGPFSIVGFGTPMINDSNLIGFRGENAGGHQAYITADGNTQTRYVAEVGADGASPYSFLFTPKMNNLGQIAGKARLGGLGQVGNDQPDEIRLWNADGTSTLIAQDTDGDAGSPYASFFNGVGVNDNGQVAYIATLAGGGTAVYLSDGTSTVEIANSNTPDIGSIESFAPAVNNNGVVVFRAFDESGLRAVWIGDGETLTAVAREHDDVPTDLGTAKIDRPDTSPVFGGGVDINEDGDVVFKASLVNAANPNEGWGGGVFVAIASSGNVADIDGDGVVGATDLAILLGLWGHIGMTAADLNGDLVVDALDLAILLGNWG